ncbi:MAG: pentapeptide repeat-containing protein [Candidatus Aminicenantes bacterium]|nr:MAG: pentapeptide repeat-containing protein [Candidatus Aminicenantes bacterium]
MKNNKEDSTMELISFNLGINWIAQLYKKLKHNQKKRRKELDEINDIMYGDPLELAKYYVEPDCQEINPADRHEEDFIVSRQPIYKKIDEFLRAKRLDQPGNNQMFILSDAGMGKTSLLVMLKLMQLTAFWPKNTACVLKIVGKETLDEIKMLENKRETILLLDALDEDTETYGQVKDRLLEVLKTTRNFFRVIITCRTQFFPEVEKNPFEQSGLISVGGYVCPVKYLSLFDDKKVELYLTKRFPGKNLFSSSKKKINQAKKLVEHMGSLRCRPMLLSYIDKLMDSPIIQDQQNEYKIYNALVDSWLTREEAKTEIPKRELFKACEILAAEMSMRGIRDIPEAELDILIADISELQYVKAIDIKGRSLLNRNSVGNYRFSHHSIQEFLVVKHCIENPQVKIEKKLPMTVLIAQMLITNSKFKICQNFFEFDNSIFKQVSIRCPDIKREVLETADLKGTNLKGADLRGVNLNGFDLQGVDLQVANLQGANLKEANLDEANLLGANLQRANLQGTSFKKADLSYVDLKRAILREAKLNGADLQGSILREANLEGTDLKGTILNGADLQGARLNVTHLLAANLQGAILQGIDLRCADFNGAVLSRTDLQGADLRESKFQGAKFEGADLSWADLQGADLREAKFQGAKFEGADINHANLQGADLSIALNISVEMLLDVQSLYQVKGLDPEIEKELRKKKPRLFERN